MLETAVEDYRAYVVGESEQLVEETGVFTQAVISGDVDAAKEQFGPAREHWERIEPIAASLGDLDPAIDAREGDVPDDEWTGFHRIEKALWEENTTRARRSTRGGCRPTSSGSRNRSRPRSCDRRIS